MQNVKLYDLMLLFYGSRFWGVGFIVLGLGYGFGVRHEISGCRAYQAYGL